MADSKEYLTKEKFDELTKELEQLKKVKRKELAEDLEYAKSLGDLSENAEYHEARENQANVEDRISKLEAMLSNVEFVKTRHTDFIDVGSVAVIRKEGGDKGSDKSVGADSKDHNFEIVGSEEADIKQGKLSMHSPLGSAMMGKKKGESFTFKSPKGPMSYKVVDIK